MRQTRALAIANVVLFVIWSSCYGTEWYVTAAGRSDAIGSPESPWDLTSALDGSHKVAPGDTILVAAGTYRCSRGGFLDPGYLVRLRGEEGKPVHVRSMAGEHVSIDGGISIVEPASHVWLWEFDVTISEKALLPGAERGPLPGNRPWGPVNINTGSGCKCINLIVHNYWHGINFGVKCIEGEVYGCIVYDYGLSPGDVDGQGMYVRVGQGTKRVGDCIMTRGKRLSLDTYDAGAGKYTKLIVDGNIVCAGGTFVIAGPDPVQDVDVTSNYLHKVNMQIGYLDRQNRSCRVSDNVVVDGTLAINRFQYVLSEGNIVLSESDPRPSGAASLVALRPNRYDPRRAHLVIYNWRKRPSIAVDLSKFLREGDRFRIMSPTDFYGKPVVIGRYAGSPISCPVDGDCAAYVVLRDGNDGGRMP